RLPDLRIAKYIGRVISRGNRTCTLCLCFSLVPFLLPAQIDPEPRRLVQIGYNQSLEGASPIAGYGFIYYNKPNFISTNLTLRLVVAPIYLDTELGFRGLLGPKTDVGVGL